MKKFQIHLFLSFIALGCIFDAAFGIVVPDNVGMAIWPALIAAGASLVGGALSSISSSKTNKTNLQQVRETNDTNYNIHKEDIQQQWDMWNAQNAYNDPSAQVDRLQRAGINPQLALANGALGSGQASAMTVPSSHPMQAGQVNPIDYSFIPEAVGAAMSSLVQEQQLKQNSAQTDVYKEQAAGMKIENAYKEQSLKYEHTKMLSEIYKMRADGDISASTASKMERDLSTYWDDYRRSVRASDDEHEQMNAQTAYIKKQEWALEIQTMLAQRAHELNVHLTYAQIQKLAAEAAELRSQSSLYESQKNHTDAETRRLDASFDSFIKTLKTENLITEHQYQKLVDEYENYHRRNSYDGWNVWSWVLSVISDVAGSVGNLFSSPAATEVVKKAMK